MYHMRLNGDRLGDNALSIFDRGQRAAAENTLGGELPDMSWWQATTGVKFAGLGLRTAHSTALAAFVASRISSRPLVCTMVGHYCNAMGASPGQIFSAYDRRTEDALVALVSELPPNAGADLLDKLDTAADEACRAWRAILEGDEEPRDLSGRAVDAPRRRPGTTITPDDGDGGAEHPSAPNHGRCQRNQHEITSAIDECVREGLRQEYANGQNYTALRRLDELSDKNIDHSWLWHLSKHHGPILSSEEFIEAVRVRLGAAGPSEPVPCARCGRELLDSAGAHAACCACAEATIGHYSVARQVLNAALQCDPSAESETAGLIPGTRLRPADVLTTALGNATTALDVGITSPDAIHAGLDCAETMYQRKIAYYGPHVAALERANIDYLPLIWSSYGRPHARAIATLRTLSKRIARRRGAACADAVFKHLHASITTEIWRRAARQVISCWPGNVDWAEALAPT